MGMKTWGVGGRESCGMKRILANILWVLVAGAGASAYAALAVRRGEGINSAYILVAALCSYAIGYRFYSKWIAARVLALDDRRATPCEVHDDGKDFVKTNRWIVFGHHFAAISGPGPLVGPVLAAQFGYLPGALWILIGVTLGGAVQDFVVLFASLRRDGKSLGQMVKEELNHAAGIVALVAIVAILIILLAVLALVVVRALAESPWGVFTVGATVPIAMFMGCYLRFGRVGKVMEASALGVGFLLLAVWGGKMVHQHPVLAQAFGLHDVALAWTIIGYGLAASVLPVWLLLAPRDYLSTFMKLGTIFALAAGIFLVLPALQMTAVSRFVDGSGPVVAGKIFPFCFITIACGSISGFHTLIASGTTPKMITRESYARSIGYGAMCLESLVAIMALIAACTLSPGVYLSMNIKGEAPATVAKVTALGFPVTVAEMDQMAAQIGEKSIFGRTGGAATLAVGMAQIFSKAVNGRGLDLWYHFAIMFEALFILTTIDAGTRVGRYLLQDVLGHLARPLGDTRNLGANVLASLLMVGAWGYFLIQGVRDPLGGINSLWPLFGIANQMLAAIALCLATTILLKMHLARGVRAGPARRPWMALVTLVPLLWLLSATVTAGVQKIGHSDPRIGFLAAAADYSAKGQKLELENPVTLTAWRRAPNTHPESEPMGREWQRLQTLQANNRLDAGVAGVFLVLVLVVVVLSVREWWLLLAGRKPPALHETEPSYLPAYAVNEAKPANLAGVAALGLALAREVSGQSHLDRAAEMAGRGDHSQQAPASGVADPAAPPAKSAEAVYLEATEQRFQSVRRCC